MHILGRLNCGAGQPDARFTKYPGSLELALSPRATVLTNEHVRLIYDGTIFDRTTDELLGSQSAIDTAYGFFTYTKLLNDGHEVILGTDKLGFSPLYYVQDNSGFLFSTSLTLLKNELTDPTLDYEAVEEIVNLGSLLGDKTTIQQIKRLDFGTRIRIRDNRVSFDRFWTPEEPRLKHRSEYARGVNEMLMEAVELTRTHACRKIALLSGGEDSRLIAIAACEKSMDVTLATQAATNIHGYEENLIIAQRVAECLDMPLISAKLPTAVEHYNDSVRRNFWLGFESRLHEWIMPLLRRLPANSLIYDGIGGDVTINGHWARLFPERYQETDVDRVAAYVCAKSTHLTVNPARLDSTLFERVQQQLLSFPDCPARLDYFYLFNRARRSITGLAQLYHLFGHYTCYPFLYYPLFLHSLSLDPLDKLDVFFERACMKELNPLAAHIPTTRDVLGEEYRIDMRSDHFARQTVQQRQIRFGREVLDIFPTMKKHARLFQLSRMLQLKYINENLDWRVEPMGWAADCLSWLRDRNRPQFPVVADQPEYIKSHCVQSFEECSQ